MNKYNFLQRQHPLLKMIFAAVSLLFAGFVAPLILLISLFIVLLMLSFNQQYILAWVKAIARISPLFISIVISGFIFSLPFPSQMELCLRISFLLTVSLFVFITVPVEFLTMIINSKPHGFKHDVVKFLWKTSQLIPFFFTSFKDQYHLHKPDFIKAIVNSFTSAHSTEQEEIVIPVSKAIIPPLYNWVNLLLSLFILAEMGLIIWSIL